LTSKLTADVRDQLALLNKLGTESEPLAQRLMASYQNQQDLAAADNCSIKSTEVAQQGMPIHNVPHFERDLHSLADIQAFSDELR
jgi:hypothetical protein